MPILTPRFIAAAKPRRDAAGELIRTEYPDAGSGLYLVVQPSGAKAFAFRSHRNGKTAKKTLGPAAGEGALTLGVARAMAATLRHRLERAVAEQGMGCHGVTRVTPFSGGGGSSDSDKIDSDKIEAAAATFLDRHVYRKNRSSSARAVEAAFNNIVLPAWRGRTITSIRKRDVIELVEGVAASGRGYRANRVLATLSKFFNWLVARDALAFSPVTGVEPPHKEEARTRVLNDDELRALWLACEPEGAHGQAIRTLILTGTRRSEAGECVWPEIDDKRLLWTLPPARTKNGREHVIPLSTQAWALIDARPRVAGCPFVFSTDGKVAVNNWNEVKRRLSARAGIAANSWRFHDLRRTCASGMQEFASVPVIEKALNHQSGVFRGIVGVYQQHTYTGEIRIALQKWADRVEEIVSGKLVEPAKVVALHGQR
jgi:integrase